MDEPGYKWTAMDGKTMPVSQMSSAHIENCIKMLIGQLKEAQSTTPGYMGNSDFAERVSEKEDTENEKFVDECLKWLYIFTREKKSRKLTQEFNKSLI